MTSTPVGDRNAFGQDDRGDPTPGGLVGQMRKRLIDIKSLDVMWEHAPLFPGTGLCDQPVAPCADAYRTKVVGRHIDVKRDPTRPVVDALMGGQERDDGPRWPGEWGSGKVRNGLSARLSHMV